MSETQDALAALRRYSLDTSRGLYAGEAVEVLKYIATLEANQKPLIEIGRFKGEIRMEGNTSSPQPPLQYALRHLGSHGFRSPGGAHVSSLEDAARYTSSTILWPGADHSCWEVVPFREYVRTTPPSREVVELEGDVCLKGLKFALHYRRGTGFWHASPGVAYSAAEADLWPTVETAADAKGAASHYYRIVGIREVPGSTVVTCEEVR